MFSAVWHLNDKWGYIALCALNNTCHIHLFTHILVVVVGSPGTTI